MKSTFAALTLLFSATAGFAQTPLTTRAFDNARSGWNPNETTLTQASMRTNGIRRATIIPLVGDARGMEAQPLIMPALKVANGTTHDVLVLPSMANVIRGVDAQTGVGIWQTAALGVPVLGPSYVDRTTGKTTVIDFHSINQHWGCLSTGVIDPATAYLYQACLVSSDGTGYPPSGRYFMFVIDLRSGKQVVAAVPLQGTDTSMWKQRSSLVLVTIGGVKTVFLAHGSVFESSTGFTGGITAFDVATNTVAAQLPMTSGIWMGGQGLIANAAGQIFGLTGNGDFDPSQGWYGESLVKVQYAQKALKVAYAWSPWTDYARAGEALPTAKVAGESLTTEAAKPVGGGMSMAMAGARVVATTSASGTISVAVYPMATGDWSDEDWGSAGPACLMAINVCIAAGKDGIGYPIPMNQTGGTTKATVGTPANYAALAAPCTWLTAYVDASCSPANPTALNLFPWAGAPNGGDTAHLHMTPVQLYDPILKSWVIFVWGENQQLHKWAVGPTGALTYVAQSNEYASVDVRGNAPGGMPGGFCSGSSNGADPNSMLLYCTIPYGDANATITNGRLLVYDPVHLAADGSLAVLWDSQRFGVPFVFNKFMPPVAWKGHLYVANYNGGVDVYQ